MFETAVPNPVVLEDLPEEVTNVDYITLKWTEPKSNGAPITHYTPYYRIVTKDRHPGEWTELEMKDALQLFLLVKVHRGKTYEFVATASNSRRESDKENIRRVKVLGKLQLLLLGLRSFGVIWIRIRDPRSVWIMVHQKNR